MMKGQVDFSVRNEIACDAGLEISDEHRPSVHKNNRNLISSKSSHFNFRGFFASLLIAALSVVAIQPATAAPRIRIIHSFNGTDGRTPSTEPPLVPGPFGLLAGVTQLGGTTNEGVLFVIDAFDHYHQIHSFASGDGRGWIPTGAFFSQSGRLYGTTAFGGTHDYGTAFSVDLFGNVNTIHDFDGVDGNQPTGAVVSQGGFFFGTSGFGGDASSGNVFRLSPEGEVSSIYQVSTLFSDQAGLYWGVAKGLNGDIVGTTYGYAVGDFNGTVFKVDANGTYVTLHTFTGGEDGSRPTSLPVVMPDGTIYGTTFSGGAYNSGTIYRITALGEYSVVYSFGGADKAYGPFGGLVLSANGNLYGTTTGDLETGWGTIFEFRTTGEVSVLYIFSGENGFGSPQGGLVEKTPGTFYGMTGSGGNFGLGTIYKFKLR